MGKGIDSALGIILACALGSLAAADLDGLIDQIPQGAEAGILLLDTSDGRVVAAHRSGTPCRLASVTKLFVSGAALVALGPDHHFQTRLYASAPPVDGAIPDLVIRGGGDPCLDEHFTDRDPDRIFRGWAAALARQGVRRITGDLIVDASLFSGPPHPPTYPQDHANRQKWYSAPASALAWNDNCIEVRAVPTSPGEPCRVETRPRSPRISVLNKTITAAPGRGRRSFLVSRAATSNTISVSGSYHEATSWYPLAIHEHPDLLAADHCRAIFAEAGLPVAGQVRLGTVPDGAVLLHTQSNPLLPALTILNQRSQNFYGEQILRLLGQHRLGSGSVASGSRALHLLLGERLGLDLQGASLVDGSGLSYGNLASARQVCDLLDAMAAHEHGALYRSTLKDLWHGTIRAKVKTGSLAVARCLAGYIPGRGDRLYAFAILLNRGDARSIGWATKLRDRLFRAMVEQVADHR